MKQKKNFFENKFSKWPTKKKAHFPVLPILNIFSWKFFGLLPWLAVLIDVKGIDVAQPIWLRDCLT